MIIRPHAIIRVQGDSVWVEHPPMRGMSCVAECRDEEAAQEVATALRQAIAAVTLAHDAPKSPHL